MRVLLAAGLLLTSTWALGYRTTWTHSLPLGLYRSLEISPDSFQPGTVVLICLPEDIGRWARGRGYISAGTCPGHAEPVGKPIAATGNHRLTLTSSGIRLENRLLPHSRLVASDSQGRPLPHSPYGTFQVPEGHLWLHAPHPRSLDSRVYGSVPQENVRAILRPVVVPGYPLDLAQVGVFLLAGAAALCLPFLPDLLERQSRAA